MSVALLRSGEPRAKSSTSAGASARLRPMGVGTRTLVGRSAPLQALTEALHDAHAGHGSLWLVTGEPGIGKSRLAEEAARVAAEHEIQVLWGRCWEAGGAPAYWPFIQVLRTLLRAAEPELRESLVRGRHAVLAELLPELSQAAAPSAELPPEQARFRLLDAVAGVLCEAASRAPVLLVLEDLHAADASSVLLLDFVARQLPVAPLCVVGTYREADARGTAGATLTRLAAHAHVLPLARLQRADVAALLAPVLGPAPDAALCDAIFDATEGNPLFVGEMARLHARMPLGASSTTVAIPSSIKAAIRARLHTLSPAAQEVLGLAAVLGRECRASTLAAAAQRSMHALAVTLDEHIAAETLLEVAPGVLRFSHILLQQVAYTDLSDAQRAQAHLAVADALTREASELPASELAHHLLLAGEAARERAVAATITAARQAHAQHAFAEAATFFARALEALAHAPHAAAERCELLLELGHARMLAHELDAGRKACAEAAALARELDDAALFARAALALGAVFTIAEIVPALVDMLSEALERLGAGDHPLRACVMARLAAALQPADDPEPPIALAREAVAMARRVGDARTLLATLQGAGSAMLDLAEPHEVHTLCREHSALAAQLGDLPEQFRAELRCSVTAFELGDVADASRSIDTCERIARDLSQPHYTWRAHALAAMRALWLGRFAEADALHQRARELGARALDPNAERSLAYQRAMRFAAQERFDECLEELAWLSRSFTPGSFSERGARVWLAAALFRAGRTQEARARCVSLELEHGAMLRDHTMFDAHVDICVGLAHEPLARMMLAAHARHADHLVSGGVLGFTWDMPMHRGLARLQRLLREPQRAREHYERALSTLRAHGAKPALARVASELAEVLLELSERQAAAPLLREAGELARELDTRVLAEHIDTLERQLRDAQSPARSGPSVPPEPTALLFSREGETWRVEHAGGALRLKDSKGIAMLARLVHEAGREVHVLDLIGADGAVDRGDAGALLDEQARHAYKERVQSLRETIEEAESFGDHGRAERARAELDALSAELARAVGIGGRARHAGSAVERARVNVQRRLRDACARITEQDAALGRHLERSLRTGTYCIYRAD